MSLYAIGDLHLSFSVDKPMDVFGRVWKNHEKKIWKYWNKRVTDRDTVVVTGSRAGRIWSLSRSCLEGRSCSGGITTCSGMPKRRSG